MSFITPSAPIRPSSLTISATTLDGQKITATANAKGEFDSEYISGLVDVEYGLASVKFGKWVQAQGNEGEDWYNANAVVDGQIFKPTHVFSGSSNELFTDQIATIAKGVQILSDSGTHMSMSITTRWADKYGLPLAVVGDIWQINDEGGYKAVVTAVEVQVKVENGVPTVWQVVGLDRYMGY